MKLNLISKINNLHFPLNTEICTKGICMKYKTFLEYLYKRASLLFIWLEFYSICSGTVCIIVLWLLVLYKCWHLWNISTSFKHKVLFISFSYHCPVFLSYINDDTVSLIEDLTIVKLCPVEQLVYTNLSNDALLLKEIFWSPCPYHWPTVKRDIVWLVNGFWTRFNIKQYDIYQSIV